MKESESELNQIPGCHNVRYKRIPFNATFMLKVNGRGQNQQQQEKLCCTFDDNNKMLIDVKI